MKVSLSQKASLAKAVQRYKGSIHLAEGYLAKRGLTLEDANTAHLGVVEEPLPSHELYRGRLVIPYLTPTGVVDIRFRSMGPEEPKYMGLPGTHTRLYNVTALQEAGDFIAVCEGEIDALTLHLKCGIPAVGVPGATAWKKHYTRILQDFEKVYVFADGDQPGSDFAKHLAKELQSVVTLQMPEGEDVNSQFLQYGYEYFREKVAS
jgi:DNA primase